MGVKLPQPRYVRNSPQNHNGLRLMVAQDHHGNLSIFANAGLHRKIFKNFYNKFLVKNWRRGSPLYQEHKSLL